MATEKSAVGMLFIYHLIIKSDKWMQMLYSCGMKSYSTFSVGLIYTFVPLL